MGHWMAEPTNLIIVMVLGAVLFLVWRAGWITGKLAGLWNWLREHWLAWTNRIQQKLFQTGLFSWYLLTGATLTTLGIIAYTKLASELLEQELNRFDTVVISWIIAFRSGPITLFMRLITNLGSTDWIIGVIILITVIGLYFRKRLEMAAYNIVVLGALGLSQLLKVTFHRSRPALPWLAPATGYSFPSGHALISLAIYGFLAYLLFRNSDQPWLKYPGTLALLLLPLLIGISRIYLGVHYPSDVLAGWTVALGWVGTCIAGVEVLRVKISRKS